MCKSEYVEKVRKLLALSESSNENEAKAAMLKAKEIMAKYMIDEADAREAATEGVEARHTGQTFTVAKNFWKYYLAQAVAHNFRCEVACYRAKGRSTREIALLGHPSDIDVCAGILDYAVSCAEAGIKEVRKGNTTTDAKTRRVMCDAYGQGFAVGVKESFESQKEEHEEGWGLVMAVPKEVSDFTKGFGNVAMVKERSYGTVGTYDDGYRDGKEFSPETKLGSQAWQGEKAAAV